MFTYVNGDVTVELCKNTEEVELKLPDIKLGGNTKVTVSYQTFKDIAGSFVWINELKKVMDKE